MNKKRRAIFDKSGGKCWYCGCNLPEKGWHVDHFEPVYRNCGVNGDLHPERHHIDNLVPACAPCNLFKSVFDLEAFRCEIDAQRERCRKASSGFRIAERMGLIEVHSKPVVFWFESNLASIERGEE